MGKWVEIGQVHNFIAPVQVYEITGHSVAVFNIKGRFWAIEDRCSHQGASLSQGELMGYEIECPLHGARFDLRTGQNLRLPAVHPVHSYPVKVEDDTIWIQVHD